MTSLERETGADWTTKQAAGAIQPQIAAALASLRG
jgi:hypothetical protein